MSNKQLITIVLLTLGFLKFNYATQAHFDANQAITYSVDSLKVDDSKIEPRQFDNLKEKYADDDFIYEYDAKNSGWWTRFKQWLSDLVKSWFDIKSSASANNITDVMLKIGGVIIFLLVVYFIFKAVMNDEGQWVFGKSSDKKIIPVTDIESNLNITDFKKLTADAEKNGEFRLAIRYYYLWLLKNLSAAELIEYDVEKTNSDYQFEIASEATKKQFAYTSYLYNYIWYGEFDVDDADFDKAKKAFVEFLTSLKA